MYRGEEWAYFWSKFYLAVELLSSRWIYYLVGGVEDVPEEGGEGGLYGTCGLKEWTCPAYDPY